MNRETYARSLPRTVPSTFWKKLLFHLLALPISAVMIEVSVHAAEAQGEKVTIQIDANAPRVAVNPRMYGVFFEEINHAGDGGLYAELVQNRDFEAHNAPAGARFSGNAIVTPKGWVERVWFNTDVHAWTLVAEGEAKGSIRLSDETPLNPENPHSMRLVARKLGDRLGVANNGYWGMNLRQGADYDL